MGMVIGVASVFLGAVRSILGVTVGHKPHWHWAGVAWSTVGVGLGVHQAFRVGLSRLGLATNHDRPTCLSCRLCTESKVAMGSHGNAKPFAVGVVGHSFVACITVTVVDQSRPAGA